MAGKAGDVVLDELIDEFARVCNEPELARMLAKWGGLPSGDLPAFNHPRVFWSTVVQAAADGVVPGGVPAIVREAAKQFPVNEVFGRLRERLDQATKLSSPTNRRSTPEPRPGHTVDNRSAVITKQINVQGNATFVTSSVSEHEQPPSSDPLAGVRREVIDFSTEHNRHKDFYGREDVLAYMDAWIRERESGWLLLTGGPGLGKSALLNQWLRQRDEAELRTAFHFIRRGHLDWAEPGVVQRNLAAQIEVMFPEQRDADAEPKYRLVQLLARVSPVLAQWDERLVLLVDGLDEAMKIETRSKDDPIPKIFPLALPDRVFVVMASRLRYPHLSALAERAGPFELLALDERAESNEDAVRAYWAALGPAMTPPLTEELVRAAIDGAEGNLLHAVKLRELWSKTGAVRMAQAVPQGFWEMVDGLWRRTTDLPEAQRKLVRGGLALVCAARESLPLRVIEELLDWKEDQAGDEFLPLAWEMLLEEASDQASAYRPFHEGLRELVEHNLAERRGGSIDAYHRMLADYAAWPVKGDAFQQRYALRHRIEHLVEAGDADAAARTVMDVGYLTAKACAERVVAVERDIRLATEVQTADDARVRLTMLGQLMTRSAHWATTVPEALPALLHDRALTYAPELLGDFVGLARSLAEHPRLRHPLQPRAMARVLKGPQTSVNALTVLPDGRIVSGSGDGTLRVWDVDSSHPLATLQAHQDSVSALAVLRDGRVVSGSGDGTLRVWDVDSSRPLATLQAHQESVSALAVLPDGRVVSGSADGVLRVWNVDSDRPLATLRGHEDWICAVAVLPDGRVVSSSVDDTLRVWDADSGRILVTLEGHQYQFSRGYEDLLSAVNAAAVLPDGRVVSGWNDGSLEVWEIDSDRTLVTLRGDQDSVSAVAVLPDGRVVSGSDEGTLQVWEIDTGCLLATFEGHQGSVSALAILPDGRIVSGSCDGTLRVWDVDSGRPLANCEGYYSSVVAVLPDGHAVSGSVDGTLRVWDVDSGRTLATLQGHGDAVTALAFLPDGRVVSGSNDGTLRVWDVDSGRTLANRQGHEHAALAAAVLATGHVGSGDNVDLFLSEDAYGLPCAIPQGQECSVTALAVLSDGRIVSCSGDGTLRVWDIDSGRSLATLGRDYSVTAMTALPDSRVVTGSSDNTLRVWDVDSGQTLATLQGHQCSVNAVAVLRDGRVVSGSDDNTLRVWDVDSGRSLTTLQGHQNSVNAVTVLPDGRVVSGSDDNTLRVWDVDSGRVVATVYCNASFFSVAAVTDDLIVAVDALGDLWFIELPPWTMPSVRARS